jgi:membrane associated rhomboid family serine protease
MPHVPAETASDPAPMAEARSAPYLGATYGSLLQRRPLSVFPLRDDNPTLQTPIVTIVLIMVNVLVWVYVQGMGYSMDVLAGTVCTYGAIPAELTGQLDPRVSEREIICELGGLTRTALITSLFLHGGWLHLIANMWFLWLFGNNVEDSMGRVRFLVFYLITGVAATLAHVYATPGSPVPVVGASGAISGVMGAYLVLYPHIRIQTLFIFIIILRIIPVPAWFVLIYWFALQVFSGWADPMGESGVAVWAHAGGFVAGVVLVKLFENRKLVDARKRHESLA